MPLLIRMQVVALLSNIKTRSLMGCAHSLTDLCTTSLNQVSASRTVLHHQVTDHRIRKMWLNRQLLLVVVLMVKCRDRSLASPQILNSALFHLPTKGQRGTMMEKALATKMTMLIFSMTTMTSKLPIELTSKCHKHQ